MAEFDEFLKSAVKFDVVTIVGEGEPTLYLGLGELICEIKKRTGKPIAVITNGALLYNSKLDRNCLMQTSYCRHWMPIIKICLRKSTGPMGRLILKRSAMD